MSYYNDYCVFSQEKLLSLMDNKCYVNQDVGIRGFFKSLGRVKKIYGSLNLNDEIIDLGDLNYVKGYFAGLGEKSKLRSLGQLTRVGGDLNLRFSKIKSLQNLERVGGNLNLRDTDIVDLGNLKYVGGNLYLPKKNEGIKLDDIEVKGNIKFWNPSKKNNESSKNFINDIGGDNLRFAVIKTLDNDSSNRYGSISYDIIWDSKIGFELWLLEYPVPSNPLESFYISRERQEYQNSNFKFYKHKIDLDRNFLCNYDFDYNIELLRTRLIYDLMKSLIENEIKIKKFLDKLIYYEHAFEKFDIREALDYRFLYELFDLESVQNKLEEKKSHLLSISELHNLELKTKKRQFTGKIISLWGVTDDYILRNIKEYETFIDDKLDKIYGERYSLIDSIFGVLKSVSEINDEFPKQYKDDLKREKALTFIENNLHKEPFLKYNSVLNDFIKDFQDYIKRQPNRGNLWLRYDESPLNYSNGPETFIFYIQNLLAKILWSISYGNQNKFRLSRGLPKIGEGWISETELFYLIKNNLTDEIVIHHGKPKWLGRQHVDIWIPDYKIGIEYQGKQHYEAIDFFGGEESFKKGQERDERKRKLFKENNATLIEVKKGYDIELLYGRINKIIKNQKTHLA